MVDLTAPSSPTRSLIEGAARQEFADHGYHGARVDRIARRAGVNKQLIYYYYGSKRGLYEHTLSMAAEGLRVAPVDRRKLSGSPSERLRNLLVRSAERAAASPELIRAAVLADERDVGSRRGTLADLAADLAAEVSRGQGLGYFRDDADPHLIGQHAAVLVLGWVAFGVALAGHRDPSSLHEWAHSVAELLSRALTW